MRDPGPIPVAGIRPEGVASTFASIARRPTFGVELGVALAWVALVAGSGALAPGTASGGDSGLSGNGSLWLCMAGMAHTGTGVAAGAGPIALSAGPASLAAALSMLALMAVAMMVPTALPAVRHVAVNSLYWRRRRAVLEFLAVFVGIWVAFGLALFVALGASGPPSSPTALALALAVAALWQLTPAKRRALLACHRASPLPPRGWRASAGVVLFGARNGGACLASCWAMMLTVAFAGRLMLVWMAALTALIAAERLSLKPRRGARRVGAALGIAALVAAALALA
jgi:predicted metal-binding membrane protein